MTIAVLTASSPALAHGILASSTVTTDAFSPPADTVLVALVAANSSTGGTTTATVTDSTGLTWTQQAVANFGVTGVSGHSSVWTAVQTTGASGMTVTVTTAGSTSTTRRPSVKVYVLAGVDESNIAVSTATASSTTNDVTFNMTQQQPESLLMVAACEWQKRGVPESTTLTGEFWDQTSSPGISGVFGYDYLGSTTTVPYNLNAFGASAAAWNVSRIEVRAAAVGLPVLQNAFDDAKLSVEIAWGADINGDSAEWVWTDITGDVRQDPGISTTLGRNDEASTSQPAECSMLLDNSTSAYSLGGESPNSPNVRRNVPVRVRMDVDSTDGTIPAVLFQGYATGFTPRWNLRGNVNEVDLSASGTLRRLSQGAPPVLSALRRVLTGHPNVVAYWPMEDGERAERVAAVTGSEMTFSGTPGFAGSSVFDCSAPLPTMSSATFTGDVPVHDATGEIQVRWLLDIPSSGATDDTPLISLYCSGTATLWEVRYQTASSGRVRIRCYDRFGASLVDLAIGSELNGFRGQAGLQLRQVGADVEWDWDSLRLGATGSTGFGTTLAGATIGTATRVVVNASGSNDSVTMGHVVVYDLNTAEAENISQVNAYSGELTTSGDGRLVRLSDENAVPLTLTGNADGTSSPADQMGSQQVAPLLQLLRECETADQGVLYDGHTVGLSYLTRRFRENRTAALVIDAAELVPVFAPVDDDQRTRNRVEATRVGGSSGVVEDISGPLGTATVGVYDTSVNVNTFADTSTVLYAGWLLSLGTVEGYRYPSLTLDFIAHPELAAAWLSLVPGSRVDVTNLNTVLPGHPSGTLSLIVEGMSQDITSSTWIGTAKCSSYEPWRISVVSDESGDTDEYVMRADTDESTLSASAAQGATSLTVATPSGPLWTTTADDYPLTLDVGGIEAVATACSGASSPQTFTINALSIARNSGTPVKLRRPTRLGL